MLAGRANPTLVTRGLSLVILATLAGGFAGAATLPGHPATGTFASHDKEPPSRGPARQAPSAAIGQAPAAPGGLLAADSGRFLSTYMDPDGRIVRRDQGADTVSEGQAYGMLVAAAGGDPGDFKRIWSWTNEHMSLPDGLLAWHWQNGRVVDQMSASDADVDAAWALAIAAEKFAAPAFAADARRIASSVLANEVEPTELGPVLVAGPWAVRSGTTEPGYFSPEAFSDLAKLTGDASWSQIEATSAQVLQRAMSGQRLPAEWISVSGGGMVQPIAPPSQSGEPPSYGLGAARVAAWWAASCSASEKRVAAAEWSLLEATANSASFDISLSLAGQPRAAAISATMAVADGLAASAAGRRAQAASLLSSAARIDRRYSTYYGGAWIALGYLLTATAQLGNCPPT